MLAASQREQAYLPHGAEPVVSTASQGVTSRLVIAAKPDAPRAATTRRKLVPDAMGAAMTRSTGGRVDGATARIMIRHRMPVAPLPRRGAHRFRFPCRWSSC
jgi:hypothetical protein